MDLNELEEQQEALKGSEELKVIIPANTKGWNIYNNEFSLEKEVVGQVIGMEGKVASLYIPGEVHLVGYWVRDLKSHTKNEK
jgi:hypothetical protein